MDKKKMIYLRARAQRLRPTIHVGKDGVTQAVADELLRQLKKNKLVKVRLLQSSEGDCAETATRLAAMSSSVLVEVRGRTVVLAIS